MGCVVPVHRSDEGGLPSAVSWANTSSVDTYFFRHRPHELHGTEWC